MELLLCLLVWIGVITQEQVPYVSSGEAEELRLINHDQLEAEYPEEYHSIIGIDENEVN